MSPSNRGQGRSDPSQNSLSGAKNGRFPREYKCVNRKCGLSALQHGLRDIIAPALGTLSRASAASLALRDTTGDLPLLPGIFPDYPAPIVQPAPDGEPAGRARELMMARWGMPPLQIVLKGRNCDPGVTNLRNVASPHLRRWLGVGSRCVVPFTSFSENELLPDGSRQPVWFALDGAGRSLCSPASGRARRRCRTRAGARRRAFTAPTNTWLGLRQSSVSNTFANRAAPVAVVGAAIQPMARFDPLWSFDAGEFERRQNQFSGFDEFIGC